MYYKVGVATGIIIWFMILGWYLDQSMNFSSSEIFHEETRIFTVHEFGGKYTKEWIFKPRQYIRLKRLNVDVSA